MKVSPEELTAQGKELVPDWATEAQAVAAPSGLEHSARPRTLTSFSRVMCGAVIPPVLSSLRFREAPL